MPDIEKTASSKEKIPKSGNPKPKKSDIPESLAPTGKTPEELEIEAAKAREES